MNERKILKRNRNSNREFGNKDFVITDNMILQIDEKKCSIGKRQIMISE